MNQSKGTGKLVGGIIAGIVAGINLLIFLLFGMTALAIKSDPDLIRASLAEQGYDTPELFDMVVSIVNGIALFTFVVAVAMLVLCVVLCKSYSKQAKLAKQNAAMGYNQYQNPQFQNQQFQNPQFQNQQFQNPQYQNQQFQNGQTSNGQFSGQFSGQNQNNTQM